MFTSSLTTVNSQGVSKSRGQPTVSDEVWDKVHALLEERTARGTDLTVKTVAERMKLTPPSISQWKKRKNKPTQENMIRLIEALGENPIRFAPELFGTLDGGLPDRYGPFDEAVLELAYNSPEKATAYVLSAIQMKDNPAAFYKGEHITVSEAMDLIRVHVGEIRSKETDRSSEPTLRVKKRP